MTLKAFALAFALTFSLSSFSKSGAQVIWRVEYSMAPQENLLTEIPSGPSALPLDKDQARTDWYSFAPVALARNRHPANAPRDIVFAIAGQPGTTPIV